MLRTRIRLVICTRTTNNMFGGSASVLYNVNSNTCSATHNNTSNNTHRTNTTCNATVATHTNTFDITTKRCTRSDEYQHAYDYVNDIRIRLRMLRAIRILILQMRQTTIHIPRPNLHSDPTLRLRIRGTFRCMTIRIWRTLIYEHSKYGTDYGHDSDCDYDYEYG